MIEAEKTEAVGLAQPLVRDILQYLKKHQLEPGDRLPSERVLAEKLGVGRNALRESIVILTTLRILEAKPNSGIYLRHTPDESSIETLAMLADIGEIPSPVEIRESIEVRTILELEAVRMACERRTESDLARLEELVKLMEGMVARGENMHEQDTLFHLAVAAASHNGLMVRVLNSFYLFSAARRRALFDNVKRGKVSTREHRQLLNALRDRDIKRAQALIRTHTSRGRDYWAKMLGDE